ncbi:MAG TPA: glycosyltransferase family 87 protein [Candidatus Limnocylindrales bacterium]
MAERADPSRSDDPSGSASALPPRTGPSHVAQGAREVVREGRVAGDRVAAEVSWVASQLPAELLDRSTRRRAGVFRRALRREVSRLREPQRQAAVVLIAVLIGLAAAGLIARGEAAGADARAYWAAVRIWLNGGDPYHPTGPFMPYVYPPWMLPAFAPWALLPWDVAWFVWRGGTILLLAWTIHWAYRRRPFATAIALTLLAFPIAANLDTGNITLLLTLLLWGAQAASPRLSGFLWATATWTKWVPAPFWLILEPRARAWGLAWLAVAAILTLATLPATLVQVQVVLAFPRPIRLDYLVLLWAAVPWLWTHPRPLWWLAPASWPGIAASARSGLAGWTQRWHGSPEQAAADARRTVTARVRDFLGLNA